MARRVEFVVNGERRSIDAEPGQTLLGALRDQLDLTGAKYGCGEGQCGACTVLLAGQPVRACITPLAACATSEVTTIEGLAGGEGLHPLQEAFLAEGAMQCGYCTAGMIVAGAALLAREADPDPEEIARQLQGNVCRCGTYPRIVRAVRRAAAAAKGGDR